MAAVIGDVEADSSNLVMADPLSNVTAHFKEEDMSDNNLTELEDNKLTDLEINGLDQSNEDFELLRKLANKLGAVLTVVTNLKHCWVIPIFPETFCLYSPHFFVAYRYQRFFPAWLGNRASVSSIRNINLKRQGKEPQCRCGRGTPGKDGQGKCVSKENGKYLTRCICFRLDRGCSHLCDCRNCENPFGVRPDKIRPKKSKIPYRQRYAHEAAKIATCKSSSVSSTIATQTPNSSESCTVDSSMDTWVTLEHCIFEALINDIKSEENVITPLEVQETFNAVVFELLSISELGSIAHSKTTEQISLKLQQRERDVSEYLKLYQMQVDYSLG